MTEIKGYLGILVNHVSKNCGNKTILKDISCFFPHLQTVVLWGESGAGKSTLLNIIAGMAKLSEGTIVFEGYDACNISELVSYMPCGDTLLESLSVRENIELGKHCLSACSILKDLNMLHLIDAKPSELSSGEYKRVCFAKCVAANTPFYLFDEPTSNLDSESADIIRNYIKTRLYGSHGIIIATHDPGLKTDGDLIYTLHKGELQCRK